MAIDQRDEDEPMHMWPYWRDKKGVDTALEQYYPNELQSNPLLMAAYTQYKSAEALMLQIMNGKAGEAEDEVG